MCESEQRERPEEDTRERVVRIDDASHHGTDDVGNSDKQACREFWRLPGTQQKRRRVDDPEKPEAVDKEHAEHQEDGNHERETASPN
ncbi:MAG: hypothetical protein ACOCTH_02100 [Halodesulfurarchaeum sp.]